MGIGSGESSSDSTWSGGLAGWLPALALAGAAFASGVLVAQLSARYSLSKARRSAVGIIPARYMSSRFEGKPLALILGKPMIQRTWEQVKLASALDDVVVATDDKRIADCCRNFGAQVVMTSEACRNGTERCEEAMRSLKKKYDIVVNVQGDEPLIDPEIIDGVVQALRNAPDAKFSTAVTALSPENALDPNRVKCVVDQLGYAIYFSRGMIPFSKKAIANPDFPYYLHLGVQCYDAKFLSVFPKIAPTPLQLEEDLEQLKVLENGYKMKIIKVDHTGHGVDVPSDIQKVESYMRAEHLN